MSMISLVPRLLPHVERGNEPGDEASLWSTHPQPQSAGINKNIMSLVAVALYQPHAAYATFIHGLSSRWTYLLKTIPDIEDLLCPLENANNSSQLWLEDHLFFYRDLLTLPIVDWEVTRLLQPIKLISLVTSTAWTSPNKLKAPPRGSLFSYWNNKDDSEMHWDAERYTPTIMVGRQTTPPQTCSCGSSTIHCRSHHDLPWHGWLPNH